VQLSDPWSRHARQWNLIGPPLRPASEDIALLAGAIADWRRNSPRSSCTALLLGVTPEIAAMSWPAATTLLSIDHSAAMIRAVWPGKPPWRPAVQGEWTQLPLPDATVDLVVGDGCYSLLGYPQDYQRATRAIRAVLRPDGLLLMRFFTRPRVAESLANVFDDLRGGRIGNFHVFKWRLAMALHGKLSVGVRLADVWRTWREFVPDAEALSRLLGWPLAVISTIDAYRDVECRYTFPTLDEARSALSQLFIECGCHVPHYELGDRCPTLILAPR
jgi:SAM-dependent methyltransferase